MSFVTYALMPICLLTSVAAANYILVHDISKPLGITLFGTIIFFMVLGLEYLVPFKNDWNRLGKEELKDIFHNFFGTNLGAVLGNSFNLLLLGMVANLSAHTGLASLQGLWPDQWPMFVQVLLIMLISDFGRYWQHRIHHLVDRLWVFHRLHHDDNILNVFKTSRSHIIERISQQFFMFLPLLLIGADQSAMFYFMMGNSVLGIFTHSNLDVRCGPFEYILMCPRNHKIHHAVDMKLGNTNFGSSTVIWDHVFGTFTHPKVLKDFSQIEVGVPNFKGHAGIKEQVLLPFKQFFASFK
jgi:sterol desaturase/sphingolipid hydroxylase (fatty acid hydroxylase superfamily)